MSEKLPGFFKNCSLLVFLLAGLTCYESPCWAIPNVLSTIPAPAALNVEPGVDIVVQFVTNSNQANRVWLNNGSGGFTDSTQTLGSSNSRDVILGDLDGDGDLDAFVVNWNQANKVWLNNGSGVFTDSGQVLQNTGSYGIAMGDVDGDGALDALVVNNNSVNRIWLNTVNPLNLPGIYFLLNQ